MSRGVPGSQRWNAIGALRGSGNVDATIRNFLADLETRFLVAEFVRRTHHLRSALFLSQHETALGRFAFGDPILSHTIGNVCIAHGLSREALLDRQQYPERCDIRGDVVNVRFCALLLRLGDLLDLRTDRACPLLLASGCPLPHDSLAHWTQYQRITHRLTAPDVIELRASCEHQSEHRLLQDWCHWLVEELQGAAVLMSRSARHSNWIPPRVSMNGPDSTIEIRPSSTATYRPVRWIFEIDHDTILDRLATDLYGGPLGFLRELIQNSLDANRARMYADLDGDGHTIPLIPSRASEDVRARYPVQVSLKTGTAPSDLSGEQEPFWDISCEDCGIGMDENSVHSYLLQIGRSFYTSPAFLRTARFVPTSRFGVGFLSVFSVSNHITIDTLKMSAPVDQSLHLTLTGPRNYLLVDQGTRTGPGTNVTVRLKAPVTDEQLIQTVRSWCKRVEFPVNIHTASGVAQVLAEKASDFTFEGKDLSTSGRRIELLAFDINRPGVDGELYVLNVRTEGTSPPDDDWSQASWFTHTYRRSYPDIGPELPDSLICFHGIALEHFHAFSGPIFRIDLRRATDQVPLWRTSSRQRA